MSPTKGHRGLTSLASSCFSGLDLLGLVNLLGHLWMLAFGVRCFQLYKWGNRGWRGGCIVSFSVQKMNVFPLCLIIFGNGWYVRHTGCSRRVGALILSLWAGTCANGGVWSWRNTSPLGHEGWQHHACHTWGHILLTLSYCLAECFPNSSSLWSLKEPVETSLPNGLYAVKFHAKDMPCLCLCTICVSLSTRKRVNVFSLP